MRRGSYTNETSIRTETAMVRIRNECVECFDDFGLLEIRRQSWRSRRWQSRRTHVISGSEKKTNPNHRAPICTALILILWTV